MKKGLRGRGEGKRGRVDGTEGQGRVERGIGNGVDKEEECR